MAEKIVECGECAAEMCEHCSVSKWLCEVCDVDLPKDMDVSQTGASASYNSQGFLPHGGRSEVSNTASSDRFAGEVEVDSDINPRCYCYLIGGAKCYERRNVRPGWCTCECHDWSGSPARISDQETIFDDLLSDE